MRSVNILKCVNKTKKWDFGSLRMEEKLTLTHKTISCDLCVRKWNERVKGQRIYFNQTDEIIARKTKNVFRMSSLGQRNGFFSSIFSLQAVISCELRIPPRTNFSPGESTTSLQQKGFTFSHKSSRAGSNKSGQEKHLDIQGFFEGGVVMNYHSLLLWSRHLLHHHIRRMFHPSRPSECGLLPKSEMKHEVEKVERHQTSMAESELSLKVINYKCGQNALNSCSVSSPLVRGHRKLIKILNQSINRL